MDVEKKYIVEFRSRIEKELRKVPIDVQKVFWKLVQDLRDMGPVRGERPNYC